MSKPFTQRRPLVRTMLSRMAKAAGIEEPALAEQPVPDFVWVPARPIRHPKALRPDRRRAEARRAAGPAR